MTTENHTPDDKADNNSDPHHPGNPTSHRHGSGGNGSDDNGSGDNGSNNNNGSGNNGSDENGSGNHRVNNSLTRNASSDNSTAQSAAASRMSFLSQLTRLSAAYWRSDRRWYAGGLTLGLFAMTLGQVLLMIWTNYWNRALFDALEHRSLSEFMAQLGTFVVILALSLLVTALHLHVKRLLQLDWRRWLTEKLLDNWMCKGRHYQLLLTPGEHDNPDARIADDIRKVTEMAISLGHTLLYSLLILATFVDILLELSGKGHIPGTSIVVPGFMVILAFVYAGVGSMLGLFFGKPLSLATNQLQSAEANFRFGLARARENSEAIALMQGETVERRRFTRFFSDIAGKWHLQTWAYTGIVSFSNAYGRLLPVFPILVMAPEYIAGGVTLGVLMQAAQAFERLTSALSWPVDHLGEIAECKASVDRVLILYDNLAQLHTSGPPVEHRIALKHSTHAALDIENLCIANADGQIMLEKFSTCIVPGERVLVTGDASVVVGLFKVVAGLWHWGTGTVTLPASPIYFMPQRPYLPAGSLRSVLCYPAPTTAFDIETIHRAMGFAGVSWLASRLGETDAWERVLPLRAQQRLGFARMFLHKPKWVFIEEASDAFVPQSEANIMERIEQEMPDATVITISFHENLENLHDRKIVLGRVQEEKHLFHNAPFCSLKDRPARWRRRKTDV